MGMTAIAFASAARSLDRAARLRDLVVPVFSSPPARADLDRSIRRRSGAPLVAVRLRGRPAGAVLADMIEGVVVANRLDGARADLVRAALWLAVDDPHPSADPRTAESQQAAARPIRAAEIRPGSRAAA